MTHRVWFLHHIILILILYSNINKALLYEMQKHLKLDFASKKSLSFILKYFTVFLIAFLFLRNNLIYVLRTLFYLLLVIIIANLQ